MGLFYFFRYIKNNVDSLVKITESVTLTKINVKYKKVILEEWLKIICNAFVKEKKHMS
jgi:hypothetical protein